MGNIKIEPLLEIYNTVKNAPYFFRELAEIQKAKAITDVDRRRRAINTKYGVDIKRGSEDFEFFRRFEKLGLGKLDVPKAVTEHVTFTWKGDINYPVIARDVLESTSKGKSRTANSSSQPKTTPLSATSTYVLRLNSSGQLLKLTRDEVRELLELLPQL